MGDGQDVRPGLLFELALLQQDLGRLASDLLMFYTQEFAYVSLADEVTTGSSIMPQKKNPDVPLAIFWPNQDSSGVHINVSGAGVTAHAKHPEAARKLLEWLSSEAAQGDFAGLNMEYPVNPDVTPHAYVAAWGDFTASEKNLALAGRLQDSAIRLMDRAGYR